MQVRGAAHAHFTLAIREVRDRLNDFQRDRGMQKADFQDMRVRHVSDVIHVITLCDVLLELNAFHPPRTHNLPAGTILRSCWRPCITCSGRRRASTSIEPMSAS